MEKAKHTPLATDRPIELAFLSLFSQALGGPLQLIISGHELYLRRLLSRGLCPNSIIRHRLLLNHAIYSRQIGIAALLLLYGADPNKASVGYSNRQLMAAGDIFIHDYYNESLAFLLLTYGANYTYKDHPDFLNENFHYVWGLRHDRLKLHESLQRANQHFDANDFINAKFEYAEAMPLLEVFLETEQRKLENEKNHDVKPSELTHPNILYCYQHRLDDCRSKLALCQEAIDAQDTVAIDSDASEQSFNGPDWEEPLIPAGVEEDNTDGLRKRHVAIKAANF